jgi:restriction endonuclease S subunit
MTHYPNRSYYEKDIKGDYIKNINKRVSDMGKKINSICFYVIGNFPYLICHILNDIFNNYPQKRIFYHVKDSSMIYAIKASTGNSDKIYYFRLPSFVRSGSTGLYSTGAYMVPFAPFKRISFEKFE